MQALELVRLLAGIPDWTPKLNDRYGVSAGVSVSVAEVLNLLSTAATGFVEEAARRDNGKQRLQLVLCAEQPDGGW